MKHTAYLGLGTNQGDRWSNLREAVSVLRPQVHLLALSPCYETTPWGYRDQPDFLNQVAMVETDLLPHDLMLYLKDIENRMGREPSFRYGPRLIDIDILFYDDLVLETEALAIPHPRIEGRAFVLVPLSDLAADLRHPVLGKTVREMLEGLDTSGVQPFALNQTPANAD